MAKKRGSRTLDETEKSLWSRVTEAVSPLPGHVRSPVESPAATPARPAKRKPAAKTPAPIPTATPAPPPKPKPPPQPHDQGTLDGGLQRRLRRGRVEPDAKLDLHGLTQAAAHQRLRKEIPRFRSSGARCLLVVTGKGSASTLARHTLHGDRISETPERRGVLRDSLPRWLAEAEFRPHVAAIRPAHPRHGGGGAFYVWLRRNR